MSARYALVTGASSGIGAAIALELAMRGWTVGCVSRRGTVPVEKVHDKQFEGALMALPCDVTEFASVADTVQRFASVSGRVDALVNAAGVHQELPSASVQLEELLSVFQTNFFGAVWMCQSAFPYLSESRGQIVNIGSLYGRLGVSRNLAYSASKAALASMSRTLAVEWARAGVSVITVAPGYVRTAVNQEYFSSGENLAVTVQRIPCRRVADPPEVARFVASIMESGTPYLTGETIYFDGGQGIAL